jgi:uncharacterized protein (TIGR02145 family)
MNMSKIINVFFRLFLTFNATSLILVATAQCGPVIDVDGNMYHTIVIGTQCWMQQNLQTAHYRNDSAISEIEDSTTWALNSNPAWCYYNGNAANNATYGKLYNWGVVNDPRGVCPAGWHVPSFAEWNILINYLGGTNVAGGPLKSSSSLWLAPNTGANNSSGFTALPGGFRSGNPGDASFSNLGLYGYFWTSTGDPISGSFFCNLTYDGSGCFPESTPFAWEGYSVRCLSDSISTGIPNLRNYINGDIQITPNPANDVLNIITYNSADGIFSLSDITGRTIFKLPINGANIQTLYIGNLPIGIYMATYSYNGETITKKIIKQ